MPNNSFKELFDGDDDDLQDIKSKVWDSLDVFRFIGRIVDVYIPKVIDVLITSLGGNVSKNEGIRHNSPPDLGKDFKSPFGPSGIDDDDDNDDNDERK